MKKTILIVEDEISERKALKDKFSREGFEIITASDGKEGLAIALEKHPDLIIVDILMPQMGGEEMIEELRKNTWGIHVPIIVLTNVQEDCRSMKKLIKEKNCRCYLIKSEWGIEDIAERAKRELGMV